MDHFFGYSNLTTLKLYELVVCSEMTSGNFSLSYIFDCYVVINPTTHSTPFIFKLSLCLATLIVIRGGVPRYRYDLLTKMG